MDVSEQERQIMGLLGWIVLGGDQAERVRPTAGEAAEQTLAEALGGEVSKLPDFGPEAWGGAQCGHWNPNPPLVYRDVNCGWFPRTEAANSDATCGFHLPLHERLPDANCAINHGRRPFADMDIRCDMSRITAEGRHEDASKGGTHSEEQRDPEEVEGGIPPDPHCGTVPHDAVHPDQRCGQRYGEFVYLDNSDRLCGRLMGSGAVISDAMCGVSVHGAAPSADAACGKAAGEYARGDVFMQTQGNDCGSGPLIEVAADKDCNQRTPNSGVADPDMRCGVGTYNDARCASPRATVSNEKYADGDKTHHARRGGKPARTPKPTWRSPDDKQDRWPREGRGRVPVNPRPPEPPTGVGPPATGSPDE